MHVHAYSIRVHIIIVWTEYMCIQWRKKNSAISGVHVFNLIIIHVLICYMYISMKERSMSKADPVLRVYFWKFWLHNTHKYYCNQHAFYFLRYKSIRASKQSSDLKNYTAPRPRPRFLNFWIRHWMKVSGRGGGACWMTNRLHNLRSRNERQLCVGEITVAWRKSAFWSWGWGFWYTYTRPTYRSPSRPCSTGGSIQTFRRLLICTSK